MRPPFRLAVGGLKHWNLAGLLAAHTKTRQPCMQAPCTWEDHPRHPRTAPNEVRSTPIRRGPCHHKELGDRMVNGRHGAGLDNCGGRGGGDSGQGAGWIWGGGGVKATDRVLQEGRTLEPHCYVYVCMYA